MHLFPDISVQRRGAVQRYIHITRLLVRRFVSAEEYRKQEEAGITEDDVNEIRQDISSFRYELIEVLRTNGMKTPDLQPGGALVSGRKGKVMERRLMKDFQIGVIENAVKEAIVSTEGEPRDVFSRLAKAIGGKKDKKDWNAMVRKASVRADPIGSKQTSVKRSSARRRRIEAENAALFSMDPEKYFWQI
jgi:transient receptor potential cation channel subfamily C protein 4